MQRVTSSRREKTAWTGPGFPRGQRRIDWIERAVEPLRGRLTDEQYDRLVSSLSIVLGWEAMIVLQDIRGHAQQRERKVVAWTARALVRAMIEESDR